MRKIVKTDIPQIRRLLRDVLQVSDIKNIERLGGLTNHTYRVELDNGKIYAVRLPGEGTEELINRSDERVSTQLACDLGIDAQLLYFGPKGEKLTCYIDGAKILSAESFQEEEILHKVANVFRVLHTSNVNTNVLFDVFEMATSYEKIVRDNAVELFKGYDETKSQIMRIHSKIGESNIATVPCHNDPLCENWILDQAGKLYLIDWEYAGMNDGMWDLADISIEANLPPGQEKTLLRFYFEREAKSEEIIRFHANKLYLDFLWALWGKARVPFDGEIMETYGQERYARLLNNLVKFQRDFSLV